jgi:hypothetical protein
MPDDVRRVRNGFYGSRGGSELSEAFPGCENPKGHAVAEAVDDAMLFFLPFRTFFGRTRN